MKCNSYGGDYLLFIDYTLIWIVHDDNNDDEDVKEGVEEYVYFSPLSSYGQSQIGIIARPWEIATDQGGSAC